ncbi:hypothetical protein RIF29_06972 [Crotalaria pallida]|uniref:CDP-diacylglycerol-glycerol-3-phosphate 3-phosphatidyltransferase n=1 Tax=Crotalaria pallida TaxID=3830 RepID=A0AAN9J3Q6_CROPI
MNGNSNSYGTSWADQWDNGPDPETVGHDKKSNNSAKYKQKLGEGLGKTKAVASTGMKKLKDGTSVGFNWIKTKYSNTKQKH